MVTDLTGVELKIGRAKRHARDLEQAIDGALHPDRYRFEMEVDPQTGEHVYTVYGVPAMDPEWSLQTGEILFNLRSALDHLAWQLVLLDGGTPGEETQFPIRETPFNKKGRLVGGEIRPTIRNPQIRALVEKFQPYRRMDGEPEMSGDEPLLRLARLNNIDKHRLLLVFVSIIDAGRFVGSRPPIELSTRGTRFSVEPAKDGAPVMWLDFFGREPPADFDPHPTLAVALREPSMPELRFITLMSTLNQLCWWVEEWVFPPFRALFP
jgi:hypothetical protein